jgi:hypothetical protein
MTWFGAAEKKRDNITDAMDSFWGKGTNTNIPSPQVDSTPQDIISPVQIGQMAPEMEQPAGSIKEQVERNINQTQDMTPDVRAQAQYMGARPAQPKPAQASVFDLGGFDAMIMGQVSKERGRGIASIGNMGPAKENGPEKIARELAQFRLQATKRDYATRKRQEQLAMMDFMGQMKDKRRLAKSQERNYNEMVNRQRATSGLPIYESPWDIIAGGKRIVQKYDAHGKPIGKQIERYGGLFGALGRDDKMSQKLENERQEQRAIDIQMKAEELREKRNKEDRLDKELGLKEKGYGLESQKLDIMKTKELGQLDYLNKKIERESEAKTKEAYWKYGKKLDIDELTAANAINERRRQEEKNDWNSFNAKGNTRFEMKGGNLPMVGKNDYDGANEAILESMGDNWGAPESKTTTDVFSNYDKKLDQAKKDNFDLRDI